MIELLVVMVIIAILSGISIFSLQGSKSSAQDAKRKTDLSQIASALEMYRADCGYYLYSPTPEPGRPLTGCTSGGPTPTYIYMQSWPSDPDPSRYYNYVALGCDTNPSPPPDYLCSRFRLWAALEANPTPTLTPDCPGPAPSCGSYTCNYCVHNP